MSDTSNDRGSGGDRVRAMPPRLPSSLTPLTPRASFDETPTHGDEGPSVSELQVPGSDRVMDAAMRFRLESELRRLQREIELRDEATVALTARLRDAEREAAQANGAVVEAMSAQLAQWQDRAQAAEAELRAVRGTKVYRMLTPVMAAYRVRRRLPELAHKVLQRIG